MNKIILLMLLSIGLFAQTSEYRTSFYNKRTNQKESGLSGYAWLVPQVNSYPAGAVPLYAVPGYDDYYYCIVPDGEYKIYIDLDKSGPGEPVLYRQNVWIGENRITTMANQFFQPLTDETDKLELSKYSDLEKSAAPDFAKKFSENFEKVDSAVKYFDPRFFEVLGDEVTLNTALYDSTLVPVADTVINNTSLVPTSASVFRADNRIRADVNNLLALYMLKTGGTFTGAVTAPTLNATTSILYNGTNILTVGALSSLCYKAQDNYFTANQTMPNALYFWNTASSGLMAIGSSTDSNADTTRIIVSGGGSGSTVRGAMFIVCGNEFPESKSTQGYKGSLWLYSGNVTGAYIEFRAKGSLTNVLRQDENGNIGIKTTTPLEALDVNGNIKASQFKLSALNTAPANSSATGTTGEIRIVDGYIYVCVATNTWKRTQLTTW